MEGDAGQQGVPVAAATAMIEADISPLAMASTSMPEQPMEGVMAAAKMEEEIISPPVPVKKEEAKDDNANISSPDPSPKVEEVDCVSVGDLRLSDYFVSLEDRLPASALDLIYWRQPLHSGGLFLFLFLLLVAFTRYSCITVVAYVALLVLCVTTSFVLFKKVSAAVQKTSEVHPFQEYLDLDLEEMFSVEDANDAIQACFRHLVRAVDVLRGLFLICNIFESIKFTVFLYGLTYVGEMFNLLTVIIIGVVLLFTIPKVYEMYGEDIDAVAAKLLAQAQAQWPVIKEQVVDRVVMIKEKAIAAIPIGKEKSS